MEVIRRFWKQFLVSAIIIIVAAWNIAVFIERVTNKERETEEATEKPRINMVFDYDGTVDIYQPVLKVYDSENLYERQVEFLDDNYDEYINVIEDIKDCADEIFSELSSGYDTSVTESKNYGKAFSFGLGLNSDFLDNKYFHISGTLIAIGFFDDTRVIYAYDYPVNADRELVVVDYCDIEANTTKPTVLDFGDESGFYGNTEYVDIEQIDGFSVMFTK